MLPLLLVFIALFTIACERDNPEQDNNNEFSGTEVSEWVYQWMNTIYYWSSEIPQNLNPANEPDPVSFFYKLIYREEDRFSYINDDFESFLAELNGTPTSKGFSPAFGRFRDSDRVFIAVEYVIPGTPADEAGLKRGDIILSIDGQDLDLNNYIELYSRTGFTAGLGSYDGENFASTGETVEMTSEVIVSSPVIHSEVIDYQDKKIGYLVYVDFTSGSGNRFVGQLDNALMEFSTAGIDDLILDLRYNPGGEIAMASYLASSLAPASVALPSNVLVSYDYNDYVTDVFVSEGGENSDDLNLFFMNTNFNLDLQNIYVMTGRGTASASELVITGLDPYMNVVTVGDTTVGKYTGAWVFPDTEEPRRHNYAIVPIVLKYTNSLGITDFKDGLFPDYPIRDNLLGAGPLGDLNDAILARTLEVITGVSPRKSEGFGIEQDFIYMPDMKHIEMKNARVFDAENFPGNKKY